MLKLTITNVDKSTADVLTYIAKKAGGKVRNTKDVQLKESSKLEDTNITNFKEQMNEIRSNIKKNYNTISKNKVK